MPNWCANRVTVSGTKEDVQILKQAVHGVGNNTREFSFDSIIPFPEELRGIGSPVTILETEEKVEEYKKEHSDTEWTLTNLPITQKRSDELKTKYGSDNWYDWCNENWTCKWDACEISLDIDYEDYLQYNFETPWGPPDNVYHTLKIQHPNVYISWFYDEPGMEFAGYLEEDA